MIRFEMARIIAMHQMIARGECPAVPELAKRYEVSPRTIHRDLEYLRDRFGAPLVYDHARKRYRYERPFHLPALDIPPGEVLVLLTATRLLNQYRGTSFEKTVREALYRLGAQLPGHVRVDLDEIAESVQFIVTPLRGDEALVSRHFGDLERAIRERCTLAMRYHTAYRDALTERHLDPYCLQHRHGAWYVLGWCHLRHEERMFAVDRIESLRLTARRFTPPETSTLQETLKRAWSMMVGDSVPVALRADAHQGRYLRERQWHPTQEIEPQPDGAVILRFTVPLSDEFVRWVLQYGAHVEVLAPPALREKVAEAVRGMARAYGVG